MMDIIPLVPIRPDRNVSVRDYVQLVKERKLLVTSIFHTIQGEGPYSGYPAVFIRLAGCNIGNKADCSFCDTAFEFDQGDRLTINQVLARIIEVNESKTDLIVVSGGEPLLQWEVMHYLIKTREGSSYRWQFETNGYFLKEDLLESIEARSDVLFVVSPKVPLSQSRYRDLPTSWGWHQNRIVLKYVVESDVFSNYYAPGPTHGPDYDTPFTTYVSGMTIYRRALEPGEVANLWDDTLIDREATARNYKHAAHIVLHLGDPYRLSYQTHLLGALE